MRATSRAQNESGQKWFSNGREDKVKAAPNMYFSSIEQNDKVLYKSKSIIKHYIY